ncbi:bifunctional acetate--CoA ligase family protein/GNAT family N-acetyltransferase [Chitinivorax sp. B]|uniref:bifunctional acetate--CoA ligase family protein/GNAT family N-acetyltransferase n=1 Tax=Chitinivorax sp. B TaxID=2502235 RepID=UPI0010F7B9D4|nr:bifunctional acetate--CoA ligase family protein/GNAT family N-acetyltransferase [Chitinivorax sp. B]
MGPHYLSSLFAPRSVALVGASERPGSMGDVVMRNLLVARFKGDLYAVNKRHKTVHGLPVFHRLSDIKAEIDLAVIATPGAVLPDVVVDCAKKGVKAAVILSQGLNLSDPAHVKGLNDARFMARKHGLRLLGPNLFGIMRPELGLNATDYEGEIKPGNLALVSQSTALSTAILDWAESNGVGLSSVVSLGATVDVDFGETLDFLVNDHHTQAILLYIEGIRDARMFMSAMRAAARSKPVIAIKAGRNGMVLQSPYTHSGAMVGSDDAFEACIRRAGAVRVRSVSDLFAAARVLTSNYRVGGPRLAVVTNGAGPGVMAADRMSDLQVRVAKLAPETIKELDSLLPPAWSGSNPVDIVGDAPPERFEAATRACLNDPGVDGVMVIFTPQIRTDAAVTAKLMVKLRQESSKPLLLVWMGEAKVQAARQVFVENKLAHYRTPENAVEVFYALAVYQRNQKLLMQVPGPLAHREVPPRVAEAHELIETALKAGRQVLQGYEALRLLSCFHIPVAASEPAGNQDEAVVVAERIGYPVAMKINSTDITYKTDVGGVLLGLKNAEAVRDAFRQIIDSARLRRPDAQIQGVTIQPMVRPRFGRELMVGVTHDAVFGPLIAFGSGGITVEIVNDRMVALPPLNDFLANKMIKSTRVSKLLGEFRNYPPVPLDSVKAVLLRVSEMVCELPTIREMDINPLIADESGVVALDARVALAPFATMGGRYGHMAIHPYPTHLTKDATARDGTLIHIRTMRPEDAEMQQVFVRNLSEESRYNRFMNTMKQLPDSLLIRLTQLDYAREIALIAYVEQDGAEMQIGVARFAANPDGESCEFALVVADAWQGKGVGSLLMTQLFDAARDKGLKIMVGEIFAANSNMLKLMDKLGFEIRPHREDSTLRLAIKFL